MLSPKAAKPYFEAVVGLVKSYGENFAELRGKIEKAQGSAAFIECQKSVDKDVRAWLKGGGNYTEVAAAYAAMPPLMQQGYLNSFAEQYAAFARHSGLPVTPARVAFVDGPADGWRMAVAPDHIQLNNNAKNNILHCDLASALGSVTLGAVYKFCNDLRQLRKDGDIPAGHPLLDDAALISYPYEKRLSAYLPVSDNVRYLDDRAATTALQSLRHFLKTPSADTQIPSHFNAWHQPSPSQETLGTITKIVGKIDAREEEETLTAMLKAVKPSPEYERRLALSLEEYKAGLEDSPCLKSLLPYKADMNNPNQYAVLQTHIGEMKTILEKNFELTIPGAKVKWLTEKGAEARLGLIFYLETITANPFSFDSGEAHTRKFADVLETLMHELLHQVHNAMYHVIKMGTIKEDHPLYADAVYYHQMRWQNGVVCKPLSAYNAQLDERLAVGFGQAIETMIAELENAPPAAALFEKPALAPIPVQQFMPSSAQYVAA